MKKDISFETISKDILSNRKFQRISTQKHHGITRMDHTLRVSKYVYEIAKKLNLDYESATRAALLHDFFTDDEYGNVKGLAKGVVHPDIALINAKGEFEINAIVENAIESHMFPLNKTLPRYKESWLLTIVDKSVAIFECLAYKFSCVKITKELRTQMNLAAILLFYIITMGRD